MKQPNTTGGDLNQSVLISEDIKENLDLYKTAIRRFSKGKLTLDTIDARTGDIATQIISSRLIPFFSLDQVMPKYEGGETSPDIGHELAAMAMAYNPISMVAMLTAYPDWKKAYKAGKQGITYLDKDDYSAGNYGKKFVGDVLQYQKSTSWKIASDIYPYILGNFLRAVNFDDDLDHNRSITDIFSFWEASIRLTVICMISTLKYFNSTYLYKYKPLTKRFDNGVILTSILKTTDYVISALKNNNYTIQANEINRFYKDSSYLISSRAIQKMRNDFFHSPIKGKKSLTINYIESFFTFLLHSSIWSLHPIISELKVVPWGGKNALQGTVISSEKKKSISMTFNWDRDMNIYIHPEHVYHVICKPMSPNQAIIIPLYPLVRIHNKILWFAHRPKQNRYRDPLTGNKIDFHDDELSNWWQESISNCKPESDSFTKARIIKLPENSTPPQEKRQSNSNYLNSTVREYLKEFYLNDSRKFIEVSDQEYQSSFNGINKAKEVMSYLDTLNYNSHELAYVSIGGADATEIEYAMKNSDINYGIIVEFSDHGANIARQKSDELAATDKNLVVLQGDAMQRINDCTKKLYQWKNERRINGVILSIQSVLHELPQRSPNFDINVLLSRIFEPFQKRILHSREPGNTNSWPETIHIRIKGLPGDTLFGICRQIKDSLAFGGKVEKLADGFVQLPSDLAIETLFKILYCNNQDRYRYEMEEKITSFVPDDFCQILRNYITPDENVEFQYLISDSFRENYKKFGVEARQISGEKLGIPHCFVKITGYQE